MKYSDKLKDPRWQTHIDRYLDQKDRTKEFESAMTEFLEINPDMFEEHEYRGLIENQIKIFSQLLNK